MKLEGVFVAPVTPLTDDGAIDFDRFGALLEFLIKQGVDGLCIGGATSEYPHFDLSQRRELISTAAGLTHQRTRLLIAVGSSRARDSLLLADWAAVSGAQAVLVPPPHFYRYSQADLLHFYHQIGSGLALPALLYNLPEFTNPLEPDTVIQLLESEEKWIGIKDSSGDRRALSRLTASRITRGASLLVGDDRLLLDALEAGWSGVISGMANLCPELFCLLYRSQREGNAARARHCQQELDRLCRHVAALPFPWGIRAGLSRRGLPTGPLPLPLSEERALALETMLDWLQRWLEEDLPQLLVDYH